MTLIIKAKKSKVNLLIVTNYYNIQGSTENDLREQMNVLGPIDEHDSKHCDSYTKWKVFCLPQNNGFFAVKLEIVFTFPKWIKPNNTNPDLDSKWARHLKALQIHEDGHKENGIKAAKKINDALYDLYISDNLTGYKEEVYKIRDEYNLQDVDYDQLTDHGRTQGAVFP